MNGISTEILGRLQIIIGASILSLIGRDRFYLLSQEQGLVPSICRTFAKHPYVVKQIVGWKEIDRDIDCARQSAASLKIYGDDSLATWANPKRSAGDKHVPLSQQMRSILTPTINAYLENSSGKTVLEIGTGNGDVIADLAKRFPQHRFIGVDLSVRVARELYDGIPNLVLKNGYALEMLERGELNGDVVFASSTFCVFPPKELSAYIAALKNAGHSYIVLVDPLTRRFSVDEKGPAYSKHLESGMWGHNYTGYLKQHGFNARLTTFEYRHHSRRNKITFQMAVGSI